MAELSVPSRLSFGLALANDLKMLLESRLSAGGAAAGAGVDSLLEVALPPLSVDLGLVFSLPFPKKSFAVEGCADLVSFSCLTAFVGSFISTFTLLGGAFAGPDEVLGGGGRRPVRRLTFLLVIVPYLAANSRGSSDLQSSWISRETSDNICRSCEASVQYKLHRGTEHTFKGCGPRL